MAKRMELLATRGAAALFASTLWAGVAFAAAKTHTVMMDGTQFVPATITVQRGDRVVWVNKDPFPHTATSRQAGFDSHSVAPAKSWRYVARKKGTFAYECTLHPTMTGTLVVE